MVTSHILFRVVCKNSGLVFRRIFIVNWHGVMEYGSTEVMAKGMNTKFSQAEVVKGSFLLILLL